MPDQLDRLSMMQMQAAFLRTLVAEWTEHRNSDDGSDQEWTKLIAQALPHWKQELKETEQIIKDLKMQKRSRN